MKDVLEKAQMITNNKIADIKKMVVLNGLKLLMDNKTNRKILIKTVCNRIKEERFKAERVRYAAEVEAQFIISLIKQSIKNMDKGYLSKRCANKAIEIFIKNLFYGGDKSIENARKEFETKYKIAPPGFCTISPTQKCNLRCLGCYAGSHYEKNASLPYWVVERLIREMHDICGSRFIVISGGEPFLWNDNGRDIISLAENFNDMFFLVYTNGTLLNDEKVKRLYEVGTVSYTHLTLPTKA